MTLSGEIYIQIYDICITLRHWCSVFFRVSLHCSQTNVLFCESAQPISMSPWSRMWRMQRRHRRLVFLKTENHHDVLSVTCRPCLYFSLFIIKRSVRRYAFKGEYYPWCAPDAFFVNTGWWRVRVMNSQFTSLRIEQSAEGYSGVKWPLALFRRANQLRSCNFRKRHKTVLTCLWENSYSRHVFHIMLYP